MNSALPPIFISHGSPMVALEPGAAGAFWQRLGPAIDAGFGRPRAILAVSAHTAARATVLLASSHHSAVHDFGNFDSRLNRLRYDVPGSPELAHHVRGLLATAQIDAHRIDEGGLDHGIWTVLRYLYPAADIPVVPLAFVPSESPARQFALGNALAPLASQGVLVLGSGSITHNLRLIGAGGRRDDPSNELPQSAAFRAWMAERSAARDWNALLAYRTRAPHAVEMHPTDEHLLPWYVAAGAGGRGDTPLRLHDSVTLGSIGMDAYAFGPGASHLAASLTTSSGPAGLTKPGPERAPEKESERDSKRESGRAAERAVERVTERASERTQTAGAGAAR